MAWSSTHTVLGELENGLKVVITDITTDDAATTNVDIAPLKNVMFYFPGHKKCGDVAADFFVFTQSTTQLNRISINPNEAASDNAKLEILSIGV
jgi:hypothetical protein